MLNNVLNGVNVHVTFLKNRLAHLIKKYGSKNAFDLTGPNTQFESEEEKLFAHGLHGRMDAFTTIGNIIGTEPTKISEIPLDEGQQLTGDEKFQVAHNAMARSFDDEFSNLQVLDPEVAIDLWALWDGVDLEHLRSELSEYVLGGNFKGAKHLFTYIWYQENVEKTNTAGEKPVETPVLG